MCLLAFSLFISFRVQTFVFCLISFFIEASSQFDLMDSSLPFCQASLSAISSRSRVISSAPLFSTTSIRYRFQCLFQLPYELQQTSRVPNANAAFCRHAALSSNQLRGYCLWRGARVARTLTDARGPSPPNGRVSQRVVVSACRLTRRAPAARSGNTVGTRCISTGAHEEYSPKQRSLPLGFVGWDGEIDFTAVAITKQIENIE